MSENEGTGSAVTGGEAAEAGAPNPSETEASRLGWRPQDQWHGKADDWVDADTFLHRSREINSHLKKTLEQRDQELAGMRAELLGMKGTVAELAEYRHNLEKRVYDQAMTDLKAQLRAAKIDGDIDRQFDIEEAIDGLKAGAPQKAAPAAPATLVEPPEFTAWKGRNDWYNATTNPKMVAYADGVAMNVIQTIQATKRQPTSAEVLKQVDEAVREMFPQAFSTQRSSIVEGSGGAGSGNSSTGKSKGFSSLPSEAKAQFEKFYSAGYYVDMKTKKPLPRADAQAEYFKDY